MKNLINLAKVLFSILVILCSANYNYAEEGNKTLRILWQKDLGCGENISCSPGAVTFNKSNDTLLIMGTSFHPDKPFYPVPFSEGKFMLWEIDQHGNKIRDRMLKEVSSEDYGAIITEGSVLIKDLTISQEGDIFAVGQFDGPTPSFMKINNNGKDIFIKSIPEKIPEENDIKIFKMISLPDNNFLLIGRDSYNKGLMIKVNSDGDRIWEKIYDKGQQELFTDGLSVGTKGDFLIVGYSVKPVEGSVFPGPSDIWILRCNTEANIISEEIFQGGYPLLGRYPKISQLDSENFVVAYDKGTLMMPIDHRIKIFSSELKVLCEKTFLESEKGSPTAFKIMAIPGGGFILANCVNLKDLTIYKYDKGGNKLGGISIDKAIWGGDFSIACSKDKAFVISKALSKEYGTFVVRIIAIDLNRSKN